MTKFEEYNTNFNEMEQWKISPAGMIQELLYSGTEVFLWGPGSLNGELDPVYDCRLGQQYPPPL